MSEKKRPSIEETIDYAEKIFSSGYNCAESVLKAIAEHYGVDNPLIPRLATSFGGGMSRKQITCGVLSGGLMAIGLFKGRDSGEIKSDPAYKMGGELIDYFTDRNKSVNCREIIGLDLSDPEEHDRFRAGTRQAVCVPMIRDICGWLINRLD